MSTDRRYIVSYEVQPYSDNFPYPEIEEVKKHTNIMNVKELGYMSFYIECYKWNEDDLIKTLKADQVLYSDDGDNYFTELK